MGLFEIQQRSVPLKFKSRRGSMPFGVGERNGGTLAPRKRVDASPRIRDKEKETRRAFQPVMDNVINVPTTRYGGMVSVLRTRGGLGRGAAACARSRLTSSACAGMLQLCAG